MPSATPPPRSPLTQVARWDAEARVLHVIRRADRITRSELVETTGLSRAAVDQAVNQLLSGGLVVLSAVGASAGGRRPGLVSFNARAGFVFGIDVGATSVHVALCDLAAVPVARREEDVDIRQGPGVVLGQAKALTTDLLEMHGIGATQILAIGMGLPGPIEFSSARPAAPPLMPGWDGVDVASFFRPEFACPVYVDNDVNVMALGEQWAGASRGVANSVVVKVGTGIGAGIISDGRLHRGADGCAGDLGHIEVDPDGPVCHCGNRGCLEAMAGGAAIGRLALRAAEDGSSPFLAERLEVTQSLTARDVAEAAQHGDQAALEIIRSSGRLIGRVLAGAVNLFNPSLIVVSGGVCGLGHLFLSGIREVVYRRSTALSARRLEIRFSDIPDTSGVVGAAILSIEELFATGGVGLASKDGAEPAHPRRPATRRLAAAGRLRRRTRAKTAL